MGFREKYQYPTQSMSYLHATQGQSTSTCFLFSGGAWEITF